MDEACWERALARSKDAGKESTLRHPRLQFPCRLQLTRREQQRKRGKQHQSHNDAVTINFTEVDLSSTPCTGPLYMQLQSSTPCTGPLYMQSQFYLSHSHSNIMPWLGLASYCC